MKVEISGDGVMVITPESEKEEQEVKCWCELQINEIYKVDIHIEAIDDGESSFS